ncbi:universal stress protein [Frigidibacter sp. MR17.24]|uniref:universal stress protein n=1 Tax=Frigidibacter sp. MR17.24 TaxID=3127345 RepID=UPI0030130BDB
MSYRTILTVVTDASAATQLDAAIEFARAEEAHLSLLGLGVDATMGGYYFDAGSAIVQREAIEHAQEQAAATAAALRARMAREDIRWSVESAIAQFGSLPALVGRAARFADLVVQTRPYGAGRTADAEAVVEAAMFQGGAPVMILPDAGVSIPRAPKRVVLAWNQSSEALAAIRAALPLLKTAGEVAIVVVDPGTWADREDPGGSLSQWLDRHGVSTEISVLAKTAPISDVIARFCRETGADMLVMGAYGHSRLREAILGGATRNMLEKTELPVFMAH